MKLKNIHTMLLFLFFLVFCQSLLAHSGRANDFGCHENEVSGGYHCHGYNKQTNLLLLNETRQTFHQLLNKRRISKAVDFASLHLEDLTGYEYALIASFYYDGLGVFTNREKAYFYAELAADENDKVGQYILGRLYESDFSKASRESLAIENYRKSAANGYSDAHFALGRLYEKGIGVERNPEQAFNLYSQAASADNSKAQIAIGDLYLNGIGVEKSSNTAFRYYQIAALTGDANAQIIVGEMYEKGIGVEQADLSKALAWFSLAAKNGNRNAKKTARQLRKRLVADDIEAAKSYLLEIEAQSY